MGVKQQKEASRRPLTTHVTVQCRQTNNTEMSWWDVCSASSRHGQSNPCPQKLPPSVSGGPFEPIISFLISFETPEKETKPKLTPWAQEALHTNQFSFCRIWDLYLQILKSDVWSALGAVFGVTSWEKMVLGCPSGPQCGCAERKKCRHPSRTRISST